MLSPNSPRNCQRLTWSQEEGGALKLVSGDSLCIGTEKNSNPFSSRKISFHARQSLSCAYRGKFSSVFTVSKPLQKVKTKGVGCLHSAERLVCRAVSRPLPWRAGWR
jgi:hypothetical protein